MSFRELTPEDWLLRLKKRPAAAYSAMYSTLWEGVVTDPALMVIPIDDHMVHRGDGVFEAFRMHKRGIYDLEAHLERLEASAKAIALPLPLARAEIRRVCTSLGKIFKGDEATFRLYVSRGPGSFSPNPYDSKQSHLHVIVMPTVMPKPELFEKGATLAISRWPAKEPPWSRVKSCNYLQNVLMKKEAVECGVDFTVSVGHQGFVYEGATENIAMISTDGEFLAPRLEYTLKGTTLLRVMDLAKRHMTKELKAVKWADIRVEQLKKAREVIMIGTTLTVLPVTSLDNRAIYDGQVGPCARRLRELLLQEMASEPLARTLVDD